MLSSKTGLRKIKISVAVVFYNPSIFDINQTIKNIEKLNSIDSYDFSFYLIDNASKKNKLDEVLSEKMKNVFIFSLTKNEGFGTGHNSIIGELNSDFHIIMNPDIEVKDVTGFIRAIKFLQSHRDIMLLSPLVIDKNNESIQYLNRKEPTIFDLAIRFLGPKFFPKRQAKFVKKEHGYDHIQLDENATGSFMIVRSDIFKEINGFDTKFFMYFEDTDLTKRISKKGKVVFYPYFRVTHGWKRDNHSLKGIKPMLKSMIIYFNKWGWKFF